jgi:hypothetical protein
VNRRNRLVLGFLVAAALFGLVLPAGWSVWAANWFFGFGAGPSPRWGLLGFAVAFVLLGWLRYARPLNVFLVGAFRGVVVAIVVLACSILILKRQSAHAKAELQSVLYRYRDAPSSLQVLDGSNRVLWRIRSTGAPESLSLPDLTEVHYGVVPRGLVQEVPSSGAPRLFNVDEAIEIQVETPRHSLSAKGYARGPDRVEQLNIVGRNR